MKFKNPAVEAVAKAIEGAHLPRPEDAPEYIEIMQFVRLANEGVASAEYAENSAAMVSMRARRLLEELMMRAVLIETKLGICRHRFDENCEEGPYCSKCHKLKKEVSR